MLSDLRYALRGFRRSPRLIATATLAIGLAAGVNTAIFSATDAVLLRPLPFREPDRLAVLWESNPKMEGFLAQRLPVAGRNFVAWKGRLHSFEQIEGLRRSWESLTGSGTPENISVARVTPGFFRMLGRNAAWGRTFESGEGEAGTSRVVVLSAAFFAGKLHGDQRALGRKLILNGTPNSIIGVLPADFRLPALWQGHEEMRPDVWLPSAADVTLPVAGASRRNYVFARLRGGISIEQARVELSALTQNLALEDPRLDSGFGANAFPVAVEDVNPSLRRTALTLEGAVCFVLWIACANVANLLLARAAGLVHEAAIRAALGASRWRVLRAAFAESLPIAVSGGVLGVGLARVAMEAMDRLAPASAYPLHRLSLNWRVLGFSLATVLGSVLLSGLAPAVAAWSLNPRAALSQNARSGAGRLTQRLRNGLLMAETAFALILLAGAGLMVRGLTNLLHVEPGFDPAHVLTLRVFLPVSRYREPQVSEFCGRLLADVSALPGVRSAAISSSLPLMDALSLAPYRLASEPEPPGGERAMADFKAVSEDYFRVTGTWLLRGRAFTRRDALAAAPQVVIVNDALATQLARRMPLHADVVGRALLVGGSPKIIVGIVAGARQMGLDSPSRPEMFLPTRSIASMTLLLRVQGDPMRHARSATEAIWAIDPDQPVSNVRPLESQIRLSAAQRRFDTALFAAFAGVALLLAGLGCYAALSHSVALRRREMGVRMALGAQPASVKWLAVRGALRITLAGIAMGMAGALALARCMKALVFGVNTADPATFLVAAAVLLSTSALAGYIPGARAARQSPVDLLRGDSIST
jgi:predicted permease